MNCFRVLFGFVKVHTNTVPRKLWNHYGAN